jgi:diguanylate cyclase
VGVREIAQEPDISPQSGCARGAGLRIEDSVNTAPRPNASYRPDALTGVYSRRWWFDLASAELSRCRRHDRTCSLSIVDLDWFKRVNDTYGHDVGDTMLQRFAEMARRECRQSDILGRFGGEEFVLVLPETGHQAAQHLAKRLTEGCRALAVSTSAGVVRCSCSIGVTELNSDDVNVESVLRRADMALYEAKRSGRDRWSHAA